MPNYPFYIFNSHTKFDLQWAIIVTKENLDADPIPSAVPYIGCSNMLTPIGYANPLPL